MYVKSTTKGSAIHTQDYLQDTQTIQYTVLCTFMHFWFDLNRLKLFSHQSFSFRWDKSWKQLWQEVDDQDKQEAATSLAAAKGISMDAAGASVLSEPDGVLTLKKELH